MEIQHNLGADMFFAFDECTSPAAPYEYQKEAMERTHRWAIRSLARHCELNAQKDAEITRTNAEKEQGILRASASVPHKSALLGVVQGGRHRDLREESARVLGAMDFDGYGIGGSFDKDDMTTAVGWVNALLPEDKPRHLLGIGEPESKSSQMQVCTRPVDNECIATLVKITHIFHIFRSRNAWELVYPQPPLPVSLSTKCAKILMAFDTLKTNFLKRCNKKWSL